MNDHVDVLARALAAKTGKAILIRQTASITEDPPEVFGIAPIRLVSEQRAQSIAFGSLDGAPDVVVSWNALSRESESLEPFALALDDYISRCLAADRLPRFWLSSGPALEVVEILGYRYRTNPQASPVLQSMGARCRAVVEESKLSGQQAVVIADQLLAEHVVSGSSPAEDVQLRALLTWIDPPRAADVGAAARAASLRPAKAMLARDDDDEVERLRRIAKGKGRRADTAKARIEALLRAGAIDEWELLQRARRAFWGLGLASNPTIVRLADASMDRVRYRFVNDLNPPTKPHTLARSLDEQETALGLVDDVGVRGDRTIRERARRRGKVVDVEVEAVTQPTPNRHPCALLMRTSQEVLRIRPGTDLQTLDGHVQGRVASVADGGVGGGVVIAIDLTKGVKAGVVPLVGDVITWTDSIPFDGGFRLRKVYDTMAAASTPLVYGDAVPAGASRPLPPGDLSAVAESLRLP